MQLRKAIYLAENFVELDLGDGKRPLKFKVQKGSLKKELITLLNEEVRVGGNADDGWNEFSPAYSGDHLDGLQIKLEKFGVSSTDTTYELTVRTRRVLSA